MVSYRIMPTLALIVLFVAAGHAANAADATVRPNFVIFFTDDLGYGDLGCYGAPQIETPNLDRMAAEGTRLTDFHVQPVCGVSRAALMTGCYPIRVAEVGNTKAGHPVLHTREITMAEVLKANGYTTGLVGKWHLAGGRKEAYDESIMPTGQGFDDFFGTPLHNGFTREVDAGSFKTQIMRGMEILDDFVDQNEMNQLTRRYTDEVVARLKELIEEGRRELGDYNRIGQGARFFDDKPNRPDAARWEGIDSMGRPLPADGASAYPRNFAYSTAISLAVAASPARP